MFGRGSESFQWIERALAPKPDHLYPRLLLAASYAHLNRLDAANNEVSRILKLDPDYSLAYADKNCVFVTDDEKSRFLEGLRKAGLTGQ